MKMVAQGGVYPLLVDYLKGFIQSLNGQLSRQERIEFAGISIKDDEYNLEWCIRYPTPKIIEKVELLKKRGVFAEISHSENKIIVHYYFQNRDLFDEEELVQKKEDPPEVYSTMTRIGGWILYKSKERILKKAKEQLGSLEKAIEEAKKEK